MTLITILGICATFFSIVILLVHFTVIGFKWYSTKSKQQKQKDLERMRQLMNEVKEADARALNSFKGA